jgi:hypothetical protein
MAPRVVEPTKMTVMRKAWVGDDDHVLAMFGTDEATLYLFNLLTDDQVAEFLRASKGNAFNRDQFCMECDTLLPAGNHFCPECGLDNEDK